MKGAPLCSLDQTEARGCVDQLKNLFNPNLDCDCPNDCNSLTYDVTITKLEWPTKRSFPQFVMSVHKSLRSNISQVFLLETLSKYKYEDPFMDNSDHAALALWSVQSTFGRFSVYFSDLSMTVIDERPVYNFVMVISNFGGLLGLYLGISVLTVLEILEFGFDFIEYVNLQGKQAGIRKIAQQPPVLCDPEGGMSLDFSADQYLKKKDSITKTGDDTLQEK